MTEGQDLLQQIARAGARMDPGLSERDVERLVEGARRRRGQRTLRRVGLLALATCAAAGAVAVGFVREHQLEQPAATKSGRPISAPRPTAGRALRFDDGSLATPLDATAEIAVNDETPSRVELALRRGRGRFEVARRPERGFVVRAGDVTVSVIGTVFTVERIADRVGVRVERGTVRVDWGVDSRLLREGESGWFPPLMVRPPGEPGSGRSARERSPRSKPAEAPVAVERPSSPSPGIESAEDLLLAADSARLAGHPDRGAALLDRLLREHHADPRAPLAAFTLGRVLLMELGRPVQAAAAFAEARRLAPEGAFAEDALAREVEAWRRAGDADSARARAREYLRLYPGGRRAATVRSMGGIE